jgi:hypothetical protein
MIYHVYNVHVLRNILIKFRPLTHRHNYIDYSYYYFCIILCSYVCCHGLMDITLFIVWCIDTTRAQIRKETDRTPD